MRVRRAGVTLDHITFTEYLVRSDHLRKVLFDIKKKILNRQIISESDTRSMVTPQEHILVVAGVYLNFFTENSWETTYHQEMMKQSFGKLSADSLSFSD